MAYAGLFEGRVEEARPELPAAIQAAIARVGRPGTWWSGAERRAIAAEARGAWSCAFCAERKGALSPTAVSGQHESAGALPEPVVDVIHRLVTDPGRLTRGWYDGVVDEVLSEPLYVELVGVVVNLAAADVFCRALSLPPLPLPEPQPGEPSRALPKSAREDGAFVRMIPGGADGGEEAHDLYGDMAFVPNIGRALSLVPDEVRGLGEIAEPCYMGLDRVSDPTYTQPGRALDRLQTELLAARVSAMNECFY